MSFLESRSAQVKTLEGCGERFALRAGVPQGAVLSPALYNVYVSDMPQPPHGVKNIIYADDVSQIVTAPSARTSKNRTEAAANQLSVFERSWKIRTNVNKFTVLQIGSNHGSTKSYRINNQMVPASCRGRFLGLYVGGRNMVKHVTARKAQAMKTLNQMRRLVGLSANSRRRIYLSKVRPVLVYPSSVWAALSPNLQAKLQTVQNKALEFIDGCGMHISRKSAKQLHSEYNLAPLCHMLQKGAIRELNTLCVTHASDVDSWIKTCMDIHTTWDRNFPSNLRKLGRTPPDFYTISQAVLSHNVWTSPFYISQSSSDFPGEA